MRLCVCKDKAGTGETTLYYGADLPTPAFDFCGFVSRRERSAVRTQPCSRDPPPPRIATDLPFADPLLIERAGSHETRSSCLTRGMLSHADHYREKPLATDNVHRGFRSSDPTIRPPCAGKSKSADRLPAPGSGADRRRTTTHGPRGQLSLFPKLPSRGGTKPRRVRVF